MKKLIFSLFLCGLFSQVIAQHVSDEVVIGKKDSIYSKVLKEGREIWIHVPPQDTSIFQRKTYPVVYLLDGSAHFPAVVSMISQLSSNRLCPEMIIVGITNTNRTRDLTPTKGDASHPFVNPGMAKVSGGGDNFLQFIEDELMPHIKDNYPTNSFEMLIGHSFGGLLAMHAFQHHPQLFDAYVSIDPSMWWNKQQLLKEIQNSKWTAAHKGKMLYLGIANTLPTDMPFEVARKDTSFNTEHFRSITALNEHMKALASDKVKYAGKYYENDDHGSVPFITEYDALRFFFDFYRLNLGPPEFMNPSLDMAKLVQAHFENISEKMGMKVLPDEAEINGMGYTCLEMNLLDKAKQLLTLNTKNYPKSFNTHDSLGDYYMAVKDLANARKSFAASVRLNPASPSKEKLEALEKEGN